MQSSKLFLVTGANQGIGKEIARGIAKSGNKVVLAVRDEKKGKEALEDLVKSGISKENLRVMTVDLSKQSSIRSFVDTFKAEYTELHGLINNGSVAGPPSRTLSEDGIEITFATNVMSYFLLSTKLQDLLIKGSPSRIVNVASNYAGALDINDINFDKREYNPDTAYRISKQADRMLSWALAEKLAGKGVTVNACHPGVINTKLLSDLGFSSGLGPADGAKTPTWLALSKDVEGTTGKFFDNLKESNCGWRNPQQVEALWDKLGSLSKL